MKTVFAGLLMAVAMAAAWRHVPQTWPTHVWPTSAAAMPAFTGVDDPSRGAAVASPQQATPPAWQRNWQDNALRAWQSLSPGNAQAAAHPVHRCSGAGAVLYTDEACPAGSQATALDSGTFTVVSGSRRDVDEGRARPAMPVPGERYQARQEPATPLGGAGAI